MTTFKAPVIYKRQQQILDFLDQFIQKYNCAPTLRQIADAMGVSSLATVHEHLQTMEEKGLIKRRGGRNRSLEILHGHDNSNTPTSPFITVPILGFIAAGQPLQPHTDPNASIDVPPAFVSGQKRVYVLQVKGDSMIEDHITDGDYVIVEQTNQARNGEIVVAMLENGMATLKRFFKEATRIRLEPANSTMAPIFAKDVQIQGKMVGLIRKMAN
ncbi:transcriptional repressor LexA [Candidatus Microgenomates bacterium]|nr:transcriptional repressor LexA [Candidatus Microgenomates bacterium]